jgi:hypothetical protein
MKNRPDDMPDLDWLVALEEIRQLKARRDRYVDAHDWDGYLSLHAPDHVSHHGPDPKGQVQSEPWRSADEMIANVRKIMTEQKTITIHHSYDPEIVFETTTRARGIWAMTTASVSGRGSAQPEWEINYGYYYETYEKRDGRWQFTTRRWQRYLGAGSDGVVFPNEPLLGSDAFAHFQQ